MKFVARKDFANVPSLKLPLTKSTPGFVHELHVHKGHRFEVGKAETLELEDNQSNKVIIAQLIVSKSAVIDNEKNKPLIAKIDAEVAAERKQAESAKSMPSMPELIAAAVAGALAEAGLVKVKS